MYFIVVCISNRASEMWQRHFNMPTTFKHTLSLSHSLCINGACLCAHEATGRRKCIRTIAFVIPINHKEADIRKNSNNNSHRIRKEEKKNMEMAWKWKTSSEFERVEWNIVSRCSRSEHKLRKRQRSDFLNENCVLVIESSEWTKWRVRERVRECNYAHSLLHQQNYFALSWKFNKITFHSVCA